MRIKAEIINIGTVDEDGQPKNFCFDCSNGAAGIDIDGDQVYFGGYSVDELRAIAEQDFPEDSPVLEEK